MIERLTAIEFSIVKTIDEPGSEFDRDYLSAAQSDEPFQ
jgi:hypothetical protein